MQSNRIAVYPGSFDPVTCGHMDVIRRTANVFDKIIVGVLNNSEKKASFTADKRVKMLKKSIANEGLVNVEVRSFSGLLVDFIRQTNATLIVKGLRAISDFEYECQMALINKKMLPECDTFFLPTAQEFSFLSSSMVRDIARYGGELEGLVPSAIIEDLQINS